MENITVLVIADRPPRQPMQQTLDEYPIDAILTLGDLSIQELRELETITDVPKFGVYGNHDSGNYMEELGIQNLHLNLADVCGVGIVGFEGSVRYKDDPTAPMYTQEEATDLGRQLSPADVLISHTPPRGIHDEAEPAHQGFDVLRMYIETCKPRFHLHGHTYPTQRSTRYLETEVVYVYQDQVVKLDMQTQTARVLNDR